jgi:serine/threonine protein kinase
MRGGSGMLVLAGKRMGRYRLSRRLGEGGMAEVFLAYDEEMRRAVAVKVVDSREVELVRRFQREVETIGSLTHEHILPVFDYGEQGEWRYLVMQYVEGGTLRERLQDGPLALEEACSILRQVASALQFTHMLQYLIDWHLCSYHKPAILSSLYA